MEKLIFLVGPTAIGKTELSLSLAEKFGCEIVSMDSMQVYKYMDIGTAKPTNEERRRVAHHLVDYVDPADIYNVSRFVEDSESCIKMLQSRKSLPLIVGGTGLYMKGLLNGIFEMEPVPKDIRDRVHHMQTEKGSEYIFEQLEKYDPVTANRLHPNDRQRVSRALEIYYTTGIPWSNHLEKQATEKEKHKNRFNFLKIGLYRERDELYERVNRRVGVMAEAGLLEEVEGLLAMGYSPKLNSMRSLGYKHMVNFINSVWTWEEALQFLARDTRHYAKRQLTWFGNDQDINWFNPNQQVAIGDLISRFIDTE